MQRVPLSGTADDRATASLTFVGNATTLLRLGGCTLLTDPSFLHAGDHVHVGYGLFAKRLLEPALQPEDLPPLDAVLLSHLHGDHWDPPAERALDHALPVVTTRQAAKALAARGFSRTVGLETWGVAALDKPGGGGVRITAVPAQHGPNKAVAAMLPATNGYVLEANRGDGRSLRVYISGDTLVHDELHEIPKRFAGIDVAVLHLGGTRIPHPKLGMLVTLDARGGVEAVRIIDPHTVVPVHTDDWNLFSSSLAEFVDAMRGAGLANRLHVVRRGETIDLHERPALAPPVTAT
jgi:L-ascorbate metabolism protein UlaG (beta-lactamase superfamily)